MKITLDIKEFKDRKKAHLYLKKILNLPDYYGENLDALYDCLEEVVEKTVIEIPRGIQDKAYLGEYGKTMLQVFRDAAVENEALQIRIK